MKTYTYKHSESPAVRPEIKAEIVALDVHLADLTLKMQGNYRELEELAEVLDSCLDICERNLQAIRITANNTQPSTVTMKDLPLEEKELIYSISFTNSVLLNLLSQLTHRKPEDIGAEIAKLSHAHNRPPTLTEVEELITNLVSTRSKAKDGFVFKRMGEQPT